MIRNSKQKDFIHTQPPSEKINVSFAVLTLKYSIDYLIRVIVLFQIEDYYTTINMVSIID